MPGKGKPTTTITLDTQNPQPGQAASFTITHAHNEKNISKLWVALKGFKDGVQVSAQYEPVQWPNGEGEEGTAGTFFLSPEAEDWFGYVWRFPKAGNVIHDALIAFEV